MTEVSPLTSQGTYVLQQVQVLDPHQGLASRQDVAIAQGRLVPLDAIGGTEKTVMDGRDWVLGPGLVDLYAHSGEPGHEQRETLGSLGQAALAGGFTQVALLPTTDPVVDTPAQLTAWQSRQGSGPQPKWLAIAAVTQGAKGTQLNDLAELQAHGAVAFGDDRPLTSPLLLRRLLDYSQSLSCPLFFWPHWPDLAQGGVMQEGGWSLRLGLKGMPASTETAAIATLIELVRQCPQPVHLMRLSQARSVALVAEAQVSGLPITASTTWLHLLLSDEALQTYNPNLHLVTPLGGEADRAALRQALANGVLGAIATDHSPFTFEEKEVPFAVAPPGAIGLELALPLLWHHLVKPGQITPACLWAALSQKPAQILQQPVPTLALGEPLTAVLFAPHQTWTVNRQNLRSQSAATSWWGQSIEGQVLGCWLAGQWVAGSGRPAFP